MPNKKRTSVWRYLRDTIDSKYDLEPHGTERLLVNLFSKLKGDHDFKKMADIPEVSRGHHIKSLFPRSKRKKEKLEGRISSLLGEVDISRYHPKNPTRDQLFRIIIRKTLQREHGFQSQNVALEAALEKLIGKYEEDPRLKKYIGSEERATLGDQLYLRSTLTDLVHLNVASTLMVIRREASEVRLDDIPNPIDAEIWAIEEKDIQEDLP